MMTGKMAWRAWETARDTLLERYPPKERHKREKELPSAREFIIQRFGPQVWEEFRDARERAGYHR